MATKKKRPRRAELNPPPPDVPRRLRLSGLAEAVPKPQAARHPETANTKALQIAFSHLR